MPTGKVKRFHDAKGYGFISPDDASEDVCVHVSALEKAGLSTLRDGQKVQFELVIGEKGKTQAGRLKAL